MPLPIRITPYLELFAAVFALGACTAECPPVSEWWYHERWGSNLHGSALDNNSIRPSPSNDYSVGGGRGR
jgi:hypothetical protein